MRPGSLATSMAIRCSADLLDCPSSLAPTIRSDGRKRADQCRAAWPGLSSKTISRSAMSCTLRSWISGSKDFPLINA